MPRGAAPDPMSQKKGTGKRGPKKPTPADDLAVCTKIAPPAHMNAAAAEVWGMVAAEMARNNQLREVDTISLTMLCDAWFNYAEATANIQQYGVLVRGDRGPMPNPAIKIQRDASAGILQLSDRLGLTPLSRLRLGLLQLTGQSVLASIDKELTVQVKV